MNSNVVERLAKKRILVVGDLMLDRFVYGSIDRISPEAPIPILRFRDETTMLGGAGNVARNIAALNGIAILVGVIGSDAEGDSISDSLRAETNIRANLIRSANFLTTVKTRFSSEGQQILRLDREEVTITERIRNQVNDAAKTCMTRAEALILSDYAKGALSPESIQLLISYAKGTGIPVIVDPKSPDLSIYSGADVITPNAKEAATATGIDASTSHGAGRAAAEILEKSAAGAVVITRGPEGMTILAPRGGVKRPLHIATKAAAVYDVSGAGDTVIATLALALSAKLDIRIAAQLANSAAGIVVGKRGTSSVRAEELANAVEMNKRTSSVSRTQAAAQVERWRRQGLKIGFANGCFDLVHPGHVALLGKARDTCDRLVVALNSDKSVKRLKGEARPVQSQTARAAVIGSLRSVDLVTLFDDDTPIDLIKQLRPDVLIKGADYKVAEVVGSEVISEWGGRVVLIPIEEGHSTSDIIARSIKYQ